MRKYLIFSVFVLTITFQGFSGDKAEVWSRLYSRSFTPELKYSVMLNIVELNDRGLIPLLEKVLAEDINAKFDDNRSITEEQDFVKFTKLVVKELGELKSKSSAPLVYEVLLNASDSLLKAEAIIALGNMRADNYVDDIALVLRNINLRPVKGKSAELEEEAKIAYGSIVALDKFKSIDGYSSVFFASIGWYDKRVKDFADKVLKTMVENPINALIPIISNGTFSEKDKAMDEVTACNAPATDKALAAREAIKQGLDNVADTIQDGMILTSLRKKGIKTLYASKSKDIEDVYYLTQSVKNGTDLEEKIYAIRTLGFNKSDEAVESLIKLLSDFNERSISGIDITYAEQNIIKELITTLGATGNNNANGVLTEVQFSGYSAGIIRSAKDALSKLK